MAARRNPWLQFSWNMAQLGAESQAVMALRMMKLAAGGAAATTESQLMVTEKIEAALTAQTHLAMAAITGGGPGGATKALAHYRRKVRANRRRLSKLG